MTASLLKCVKKQTNKKNNLPVQYEVIRCVCARRLSPGLRHEPPYRWSAGLFHDFFFKSSGRWSRIKNRAVGWRCSPWVDWRHVKCLRAFSVAFYAGLPVERRNWMDNPKPEFLWVFAADKTPLLHKHSPSCSNRFANLILKHFSVPIVARTSWREHEPSSFLTSWPPVACKPQDSTVAYWKAIFIYWNSLECQSILADGT